MENLINELKEQIKLNYELANMYKKDARTEKKKEKANVLFTIYVAIKDTTSDIEKIIENYGRIY